MRTEVDQIECLSHEHHSHIMGHLPHATLRLRNICRQQPTLTHQNQKRCSILYREYRPNFTTRHSLQIRYEVKCTTDILKLSTPCLVAAYHFFLFQLNAHHTLKKYIYHQLRPTCFAVCYTIFRETIALLAQKLYACGYVAVQYKKAG